MQSVKARPFHTHQAWKNDRRNQNKTLLGLGKARFATLQTTILSALPSPENFGHDEWFQRSSSRPAGGTAADWCVYWRNYSSKYSSLYHHNQWLFAVHLNCKKNMPDSNCSLVVPKPNWHNQQRQPIRGRVGWVLQKSSGIHNNNYY